MDGNEFFSSFMVGGGDHERRGRRRGSSGDDEYAREKIDCCVCKLREIETSRYSSGRETN